MSAIDLFETGAYFRAPGGNVEDETGTVQKPVIKWAAYSINPDNSGGGSSSVWTRSRMLWDKDGIKHFPWLHCHTIADVKRLIAAGKADGSEAIGLNIEDVFTDKLDLEQVAFEIHATWPGFVHMVTLPWVQNGQGWENLDFAVAALGIFSETGEQVTTFPDGYDPKIVSDCILHAFEEGLLHITLLFDTKKPATRELYGEEFEICHSFYTGDDIGSTQQDWAAWDFNGQCLKPTKPGEEDMAKIGSQHGITAYMNWLREQPNVPQRGPGYDPAKIETWPWPDKIERTLNILREDHDKGMV